MRSKSSCGNSKENALKRNLYLKTTPVEEARDIYLKALGNTEARAETVRVIDALGRVTSDAVYARYSSPLYSSAAMDGIKTAEMIAKKFAPFDED